MGYDVRPDDPPEGQRILASSVREEFTRSSSGALVLATPESTAPIALTVEYAGIVAVRRNAFSLP
jgi:hypothetical protein